MPSNSVIIKADLSLHSKILAWSILHDYRKYWKRKINNSSKIKAHYSSILLGIFHWFAINMAISVQRISSLGQLASDL